MSIFSFFRGPDINSGVEEYKAADGAVLVDVRERDEFALGHIEDAVNIPLSAIDNVSAQLKDKEQAVFVYCLSGARSGNACSIMKRMGYSNVKNIGGIAAYEGKISKKR